MRRLLLLTLVLLLTASFASGTYKLKPVALPLTFEQNRGQVAGTAAYLSRSSGADFAFDNDGFTALLSNGRSDATIQVRFDGANQVSALPESKTGGVSNYYLGPQRTKWLEGIPHFRQLRYPELYPGIDAVFHGREGRLEYDFEVKPGASPDQIIVAFDPGVALELGDRGALLAKSGDQVISFLAPEVYQEVSNTRTAVEGKYRFIDKHHIAFSIGKYDHSKLLTIDPVVVYTRIVASLEPATVNSAAIDTSGNLYLTGEAPVHNVNADFLHVTKLDPSGENILFFTQIQGGFGDHVPVGKTSPNLAISIFNSSNSAVPLPAATLSPSTFTLTGTTCTGPLPAHQGCAFSIQFTPTANGEVAGKINVSAGSGTASADLYATGKVASSLSVYPLQLPMFYPVLGVATFPNRVELTNNAQSPVTVTGISFDLPDYQQTNSCQSPLPPGGKCDIEVTITPQELGDRSGTMKLDFDSASSQQIPLNAFAKYPVNTLINAVDFASYTPVGVVSDPAFVGLYSNAQSGIHITFSVSISGPFEITGDYCNNQIPADRSCGLAIVFHPLVAGPQQGALTISYPGTSLQTVLPLTGDTSSPGILIFPKSLEFPNIAVGTTFGPFKVTLRNPLSYAVSVPQPVLTGPGADAFQLTDPCDTILAGASCDVTVTFAPRKGGTHSATLTFQNGGTPATLIPIALTGSASDVPGFDAYWIDGNFYNVDVGKSSRQLQLTIHNRRAEAHALPPLTLSGDQSGDFTAIPDASCQMVAAYGTCIVRLTFTPSALGPRSAVLSFDSQSTDGHVVQIPLSGRGTEFKFSASNVTTASITAGQIATFDLQLEASVASYGSVDITCTPVGANYGTCRFIQNSVNLETGTGKVTINISPAGPNSANIRRKNGSFYSSLFVAVSLPFATFFAIRRRNGLFATMVLLVASLMLTSCGGGAGSSGGTPPPTRTTTTYTYSVIATNYAGTARTTQLTVTVTSN